MASIALPISGLVNINVVLSVAAAQAQNTTTLMALTPSAQLDLITRISEFPSLAAVQAFFGPNGPEAAVATVWFAQTPQPTTISFGRWVQIASAGQLKSAPLTSVQQNIVNFNTIALGSFTVQVDGAAAEHISGIVLTGVQNLNAVASAINTQLLGATCVWNGTNFVFTSNTTGALSSVSFLTAGTAGTDISGILQSTAATRGAYLVPGAAPETAVAAVELLDADFGSAWYGLDIPTGTDADRLAVGPIIEASTNKHFFFPTSQDPDILVATSTTDLAFELSALKLTKTALQYSSTSLYAGVSMAARILTTNYAGNSTVITEMYKQEPTVVAESLSQTQLNTLLAKNCNVFVNYAGGVTIIQPGTTCTPNQFIDTIIGVDNLAIQIQLAIFNLLFTSLTKVPQTDGGMAQIVAAAEAVCLQFVADGLLAPGVWTQPGFGALVQGQNLEKGYYIYAPPVATQLQAARASRMSVPLQIAVKLAGAVQTVAATIFVNP